MSTSVRIKLIQLNCCLTKQEEFLDGDGEGRAGGVVEELREKAAKIKVK